MAEIRQDKAWLLAQAKALAKKLKSHSEGTSLRIRIPRGAWQTNTAGWFVQVGDLGPRSPWLELWLDRFSGYQDRKLFACFRSNDRPCLVAVTKRATKRLWPVRTITVADTAEANYFSLAQRLKRSEFNVPILEKYDEGATFFGIYDLTRSAATRVNPYFIDRAAAFFEDVARAQPQATSEEENQQDYPYYENRQKVASHLTRERSRLLATERKILDDYECQVCGIRFESIYGKKLGRGFAEAHHLVPLSKLRGTVRTTIDELRTVCANCHRMLHRMKGQGNDLSMLKRSVRARSRN